MRRRILSAALTLTLVITPALATPASAAEPIKSVHITEKLTETPNREPRPAVHHLYQTDGSSKAPAEDWMTEKQCRDDWSKRPDGATWWVRNHFSACHMRTLRLTFKVCQAPNVNCRDVGETEIQAIIIGKTWNTAGRKAEWTVFLRDWKILWGTEHPDVKIRVDPDCEIIGNARGVCHSIGENGAIDTLAGWRSLQSIRFDYNTIITTDAESGDKNNKLSTQFDIDFTPVPAIIGKASNTPRAPRMDN